MAEAVVEPGAASGHGGGRSEGAEVGGGELRGWQGCCFRRSKP